MARSQSWTSLTEQRRVRASDTRLGAVSCIRQEIVFNRRAVLPMFCDDSEVLEGRVRCATPAHSHVQSRWEGAGSVRASVNLEELEMEITG